MNHEQQVREEEIFLQALEIAPGKERTAWLEEACGWDADLRRDIEELLGAHDEPAPLFRDTGLEVGSSKAVETSGEKAGDRFGRYELIEETGRGGTSSVTLATSQ